MTFPRKRFLSISRGYTSTVTINMKGARDIYFTPGKVLTMYPVYTFGKMVGRVGFEPTTKRLKVFCSTN
jgi:hypothetical protein